MWVKINVLSTTAMIWRIIMDNLFNSKLYKSIYILGGNAWFFSVVLVPPSPPPPAHWCSFTNAFSTLT